jgi:chromosome segregation ATPase
MSFFKSLGDTVVHNVHDGAVKTLANIAPDVVGETQVTQWRVDAAKASDMAAKAATDLETAQKKFDGMKADIARYTTAAEKLMATNESAANTAVDRATQLTNDLPAAESTLAEAKSWASETETAAIAAEKRVSEGRAAIDEALHAQVQAKNEAAIAAQRLADRERLAGINNHIDGADAAINALKANAAAARQQTASANMRSKVLGANQDADAAINAALGEIDHGTAPQTLAEKLAALKANQH